MPELERNLVVLGAELEFPSTPNLAGAVARRLAEGPRRRLAPHPVFAAAALLAAVLAAALAIPPARSAILRFFHLQGVTIERVGSLPRVPQGAAFQLGDLLPTEEAQGRVDFEIVLPKLEREPRSLYVQELDPPGGQVSLIFRSRSGARVLLTEFRGTTSPFIEKSAGPGTHIETVDVAGEPGFWLEGARHVITVDVRGRPLEQRVRLAGNVLVWERRGLTLRLEGRLSKNEALDIARSIG
jgi:hypothetical protein